MNVHRLPRGEIHRARAEDVYPLLEPGSVALVISDGPYAMGKADWDRMRVDDLPDWYAPHVEAWGRVCAASATVYLWGTAEGWARLDPVMRAAGWEFCVLVTWAKTNPPSMKGVEMCRSWPDVTEVCGMYRREALSAPGGPAQLVAYAAGASPGNTIRQWLHAERARSGMTGDELEAAVNEAGGKGNMICRHSFTESQWAMPTFEQWTALHQAWNRRGDPAGRPYLQRAERGRVWDLALRADYEALRADYEALRADYEALRADYEALRVPFALPAGLSNIWTAPLVAGPERLKSDNGDNTRHACQKPIAFSRRIVLASSRPGDLVLEPFGGTCRVAVAVEGLPPAEARRYVCVEPDEDGRDYLPAVLADLHSRGVDAGADVARTVAQVGLFGGFATHDTGRGETP